MIEQIDLAGSFALPRSAMTLNTPRDSQPCRLLQC
jgi:hypothetical protein